eukprot:2700356-Prymnesium_polylepis.1
MLEGRRSMGEAHQTKPALQHRTQGGLGGARAAGIARSMIEDRALGAPEYKATSESCRGARAAKASGAVVRRCWSHRRCSAAGCGFC